MLIPAGGRAEMLARLLVLRIIYLSLTAVATVAVALWLELLLRTSAPPRAALFTLAPFPGEPCAPLPGDRYQIQPFVAPRLKSAGLVEVHFFSEAGEPLTTVSRLLIELGNK